MWISIAIIIHIQAMFNKEIEENEDIRLQDAHTFARIAIDSDARDFYTTTPAKIGEHSVCVRKFNNVNGLRRNRHDS
jgi:hypothetical protein